MSKESSECIGLEKLYHKVSSLCFLLRLFLSGAEAEAERGTPPFELDRLQKVLIGTQLRKSDNMHPAKVTRHITWVIRR